MSRENQDNLYIAEDAASIKKIHRHLNLVQAQAFVDTITSADWWAETYSGIRSIEVLETSFYTSHIAATRFEAGCEFQKVHIKKGQDTTDFVLLHEIAHLATDFRFPGLDEGHGPYFARLLLEIVYRVLGTDAWITLKESFEHHGVCYDERTTSAQ